VTSAGRPANGSGPACVRTHRGLGDGDDVKFDAEIGGQLFRVGDGMIGAESAGHGDADDFVLAERATGEGGGERRIDAAGRPSTTLLNPHLRT
jgi:hypothetical protein